MRDRSVLRADATLVACELQLHHDSHQRVIKTTAPAKIARQAMTENAIRRAAVLISSICSALVWKSVMGHRPHASVSSLIGIQNENF